MALELKRLAVETFNQWNEDEAPRMGASLAYYTILSMAPLLIVVITIAGYVFGQQAAQGTLFYQIQELVGPEGAQAIQSMVEAAGKQKATGVWASVLGFAALLFGASAVIGELRTSLNKIWKVKQPAGDAIKSLVKEKSYAIGVVMGTGFLLLVALVVNAALSTVGKYFQNLVPTPSWLLQIFNFTVSFVVITALFALIYKVLPQIEIRWYDVWLGAAVTSLLFAIGKLAIGLYLGRASFGSSYGAAGSVVIVLVWVYYSAQIFFFGAEFTHVFAQQHGSQRGKDPVPLPAPVLWQSQSVAPHSTMAAAITNGHSQLLPILPEQQALNTHSQEPLLKDLAVIIGATAGLGVTLVNVFRQPEPKTEKAEK